MAKYCLCPEWLHTVLQLSMNSGKIISFECQAGDKELEGERQLLVYLLKLLRAFDNYWNIWGGGCWYV